MEIICDDRESYVNKYLDKYADKYNISYKIERINVGDFAITFNGKMLLIIERKTWNDLAASMTDGRKDNINKLKSLRDETGCYISYLIEGDATPNRKKYYNNFPYKNLRAHLDHIMFRDNIHICHSNNHENSAYRLFELANNFLTNKVIIDKYKVQGGAEDNKLLKKKYDSCINRSSLIIKRLPYIGSILSDLLVENKITIKTIANKTVDIDKIADIKYLSGKRIGYKKAEKIFNNYKILSNINKTNKKIHVNILSEIPLISKKTAEKIIDKYNLIDIINDITKFDDLKTIKPNKKYLGDKAVNNIINFLTN